MTYIQAETLSDALAAVQKSDLECLSMLLGETPALVSARLSSDAIGQGRTLLHAAMCGLHVGDCVAPDRVDVVKLLIAAGADVNATVGDGATPLHFAATMNLPKSVEVLIAAGANLKAEDAGAGGTPLVQALFYGCPSIADTIASRDITPLNLRVAAGLGRIDLLDALLNTDGTLTSSACEARGFYRPHDEFVDWTPSNSPQEVLDEALVYAANNGRIEALQWMLGHGADIDGCPYFGTALHFASYNGNGEIVQLLLASGARSDIVDRQYHGTAAGWATHGGHPEIAGMIESHHVG